MAYELHIKVSVVIFQVCLKPFAILLNITINQACWQIIFLGICNFSGDVAHTDLDYVRVGQEENDLCPLDPAVFEHFGEVFPELCGPVSSVQWQLKQLTARDVTGQLNNGGLPCTIHTNLSRQRMKLNQHTKSGSPNISNFNYFIILFHALHIQSSKVLSNYNLGPLRLQQIYTAYRFKYTKWLLHAWTIQP